MMKIAFLDNQLENWHANTFRNLLGSGEYDARLHAVSSEDHEAGRLWAAASEIPYVDDIRDLKGEVDAIMLLAPSNPDAHVGMVARAVELKVPVYVDKTFAPTLADAKTIFAIADRAGLPLFSTSALRCADELKPLREWGENLLQAQAYGGGGNFAEYVIHPLEMLVSLFGAGVSHFDVRKTGEFRQITLDFGSRVGTLFCYPKAQEAFRIVAARDGTVVDEKITSPIFKNLMRDILQFFSTGREPVCREETLKIIELIEQFTYAK